MERIIAILAVLSVCAAARGPHRFSKRPVDLEYPQPITMDRFEAMLQRASQILRSPPQVIESPVESHDERRSQRERDHDLDDYLPIYHHGSEKSKKTDSKSRQLQYMVPPSEDDQETNFYVIKQKKVPKKFMRASKQINVKFVDDNERDEYPVKPRGYSKEHNIIFDDTFFGVDAQAAVPDEIPQEHSNDNGFIAPIYSRRLHKTDDMFATSTKRDARMRMNGPISRYSFVGY